MPILRGEYDSIYVAGSNGMVGSALCKLLNKNGYTEQEKNLLTTSRKKLDLLNTIEVNEWFKRNTPEVVIIAAAKVGGILANKNSPVEFLLENIKLQNNLIEASRTYGVKKLLFLGSSCIYPKLCKQPIKENFLLTGELETTNEYYAIAKIAGLKLCQAYRKQYNFDAISLMPTNLYGPRDNYHPNDSHVMASLIRKFHNAKINHLNNVTCWGTGKPLREFLYVEDFAEACLFLLKKWDLKSDYLPKDINGNILNWINVGSDFEISIRDLAEKISKIVGFSGEIIWDRTKPDGTPRKKLDNSCIKKIGWKPTTDLDVGIRKTIKTFVDEQKNKFI